MRVLSIKTKTVLLVTLPAPLETGVAKRLGHPLPQLPFRGLSSWEEQGLSISHPPPPLPIVKSKFQEIVAERRGPLLSTRVSIVGTEIYLGNLPENTRSLTVLVRQVMIATPGWSGKPRRPRHRPNAQLQSGTVTQREAYHCPHLQLQSNASEIWLGKKSRP